MTQTIMNDLLWAVQGNGELTDWARSKLSAGII